MILSTNLYTIQTGVVLINLKILHKQYKQILYFLKYLIFIKFNMSAYNALLNK